MRRWSLGGLGGGVFGVHCRCCGVGIVVGMWVLGGGLEHGGLDEWVEFRGGGEVGRCRGGCGGWKP